MSNIAKFEKIPVVVKIDSEVFKVNFIVLPSFKFRMEIMANMRLYLGSHMLFTDLKNLFSSLIKLKKYGVSDRLRHPIDQNSFYGGPSFIVHRNITFPFDANNGMLTPQYPMLDAGMVDQNGKKMGTPMISFENVVKCRF